MGQKVGTVVANFMQENPALLNKLNQVDMDALAEDIGPKVEKTRAQVQQALKKLPQGLDKRLIRMLDPGTAKLATEFDEWLRKEPDPALLAEMDRAERMKARTEALEGKVGSAKPSPYADDPFAVEDPLGADPFAESLPVGQPTLKDKLMGAKDKWVEKAQTSWPLNKNKKSDLTDLDALLGSERVTSGGASKRTQDLADLLGRPRPASGGAGGGDELTDADLDALLGGGGLSFKANPRHSSKPAS